MPKAIMLTAKALRESRVTDEPSGQHEERHGEEGREDDVRDVGGRG